MNWGIKLLKLTHLNYLDWLELWLLDWEYAYGMKRIRIIMRWIWIRGFTICCVWGSLGYFSKGIFKQTAFHFFQFRKVSSLLRWVCEFYGAAIFDRTAKWQSWLSVSLHPTVYVARYDLFAAWPEVKLKQGCFQRGEFHWLNRYNNKQSFNMDRKWNIKMQKIKPKDGFLSFKSISKSLDKLNQSYINF